ncbi:MAG: ABC transporter permease [Myxococcales bacterium]|nr:ABC transporter permease [Myxococcales bacterium]
MLAYTIRRLLYMFPVLLGVAALVFSLFNTVGEDPVRVALGQHATPESIADLEAQWGLDQPLYKQFLDFLVQIATFDYGRSYDTGEKLSDMFAAGAPVSLSLTLPPFVIGLILNVSLGLLIAYYRGSWLDRFSTALFIGAMSISYLAYIIGFQYVLAYRMDWFPISGYEPGIEGLQFLLLPWIIYLVVSVGPDVRMYRTVFLDETGADYVRTARAKGVSENRMLFGHVLKNAMIPIVTYSMVAVPFLILGAFLMERFFSLPGIGDLMITAINNGDFPVLKGLTMLIAMGYSLIVLLTDIVYAWVDPRVSLS